MKNTATLTALVVFLIGCDAEDGRKAKNAMFPGTLPEACGKDCLFWSEVDQTRTKIGRDGLRVYIEPSFGEFDHRFEILPKPLGCITIWPDEDVAEDKNYCAHYLVRMRKQISSGGNFSGAVPFEDYSFILPQEDARELLGVADKLSTEWPGSSGASFTVDGTMISFELAKRGKVRSMRSNDSLDSDHRNPAAWVAAELHRFALAYGPTGQIPRNADWHSYINEDGRFPCNNPGFNVPDPDGFGTGDDACARSLTDEPSR